MNGRRSGTKVILKVTFFTFSTFLAVHTVSTIAFANSASSTAAPAGSVTSPDGIGGSGYLAPNTVYVPPSSIENAGDAGRAAHTNYVLFSPNGGTPAAMVNPS